MAAEQKKNTDAVVSGDGFVIDFSNWKMKQKRAFVRAVNGVSQSGDEGEIYVHYAQVVKAWPFEGLDPSNPDDYDELEAVQFKEVTEKVSEAIKSVLS